MNLKGWEIDNPFGFDRDFYFLSVLGSFGLKMLGSMSFFSSVMFF